MSEAEEFLKNYEPLTRIIREGTVGDCPKCHSTTIKRFIFFGMSIGCIQPQCENYYKKELMNKQEMNKQEIEREVKDRLNEALECFNDDGSILSVEYDEKTETVTVKLPIIKTEELTPNGETWTNITFNSY